MSDFCDVILCIVSLNLYVLKIEQLQFYLLFCMVKNLVTLLYGELTLRKTFGYKQVEVAGVEKSVEQGTFVIVLLGE